MTPKTTAQRQRTNNDIFDIEMADNRQEEGNTEEEENNEENSCGPSESTINNDQVDDLDPVGWVNRMQEEANNNDPVEPQDQFARIPRLGGGSLTIRRRCDPAHIGETRHSRHSMYASWPVDWRRHFDPDYDKYKPDNGDKPWNGKNDYWKSYPREWRRRFDPHYAMYDPDVGDLPEDSNHKWQDNPDLKVAQRKKNKVSDDSASGESSDYEDVAKNIFEGRRRHCGDPDYQNEPSDSEMDMDTKLKGGELGKDIDSKSESTKVDDDFENMDRKIKARVKTKKDDDDTLRSDKDSKSESPHFEDVDSDVSEKEKNSPYRHRQVPALPEQHRQVPALPQERHQQWSQQIAPLWRRPEDIPAPQQHGRFTSQFGRASREQFISRLRADTLLAQEEVPIQQRGMVGRSSMPEVGPMTEARGSAGLAGQLGSFNQVTSSGQFVRKSARLKQNMKSKKRKRK